MIAPSLITVVVSTYNWPRALDAVLSALGDLDHPEFEIVVADDGSDLTTTELVHGHGVRNRYPVIHVWQPDEGFRAAEIRNKAILKSSGDYVIFLDGDCIPRPRFISRHAALAERGFFVTGNRVSLRRKTTEEALTTQLALHRLTFKDWIRWRLRGRVKRILPLFSLPDAGWRFVNRTKLIGAMSCNLAVWRDDLQAVNGFDARYQGWGLEDSDLAVRLFNSGIFRKEGRLATTVIHLWHEERDRSGYKDRMDLFQSVQASGATRAVEGLAR